MDGVIANFEQRLLDVLIQDYPHVEPILLEDRIGFNITDQYPQEHYDTIWNIMRSDHFALDLLPVEGGLEAVQEMYRMGIDVRICTSGFTDSRTNIGDKNEWVRRHLGDIFVRRLITTDDKTLVYGQFLIDDKSKNRRSPESSVLETAFV
jgi:5'(3')-deoxyribonucleotidase